MIEFRPLTYETLEVWCENQHGENTAVGTASGLERPEPRT
jgi:hypothetical protein